METKPSNATSRVRMALRYVLSKMQALPVVQTAQNYWKTKAQIRFCRDDLRLHGLVFDIGAHAGMKTNIFLHCDCSVVAIEPQQRLAEHLRTAYADNASVFVEQVGVGEKAGTAVINISSRYSGFSSFNKSWQEGTKYHTFDSTETVPVTTLDALIAKYGLPYFCKIDVEGFEPYVFMGLTKKIPLLNFEFHPNDRAHVVKCVSRLQEIGYTEFNFVAADNPKMASERWMQAKDLWPEIEKKVISESIAYGDIYAR